MLKNSQLQILNDVLCSVADCKEDQNMPFGNKTMILFGDLCQLPPVIKNLAKGVPV